ncbi:unnamed protein product [Calicophoron daubneyi]|uniref:G-protein coupled receptors family 1 profile domain-containing protein n=1 Tax=Calicophoron daubneyi TaxID=300641 RepID=A0AAV2TKZ7_CALDB
MAKVSNLLTDILMVTSETTLRAPKLMMLEQFNSSLSTPHGYTADSKMQFNPNGTVSIFDLSEGKQLNRELLRKIFLQQFAPTNTEKHGLNNLNEMWNLSVEQIDYMLNDPVRTDLMTPIITTVILLIIALVGITGNGLVVWAFRCQVSQGIVSSLLILVLACIDLTICVLGIPSTIYLDVWSGTSADFVCRIHMAFKGFIIPVSASLLILIAMERFLLICFIPGIGLKHIHLIVAFVLILITGLALATPMCLHTTAVKAAKDRDELLDLHLNALRVLQTGGQRTADEVAIPVRCDKDDTFISDAAYWYYQVATLVWFVFLFTGTTLIYGVIFLFVCRHESLMFERYGESQYRGYWIRIYASKRSRKTKDAEASIPLNKLPPSENCSHLLEKKLAKSTLTGHPEGESHTGSLQCACSCENGAGEQTGSCLTKTPSPQWSRGKLDQNVSGCRTTKQTLTSAAENNPGLERSPNSCCHDRKYICCCLNDHGEVEEDREAASSGFSPVSANTQARTNWAASTMERRRHPHIRTAQTFALIAAAFIISYTPYLISTTMPVTTRAVEMRTKGEEWTDRLRRILFYLYFANSAANPIIYSCMNRHFRSRLSQLRGKLCQLMSFGSPATREERCPPSTSNNGAQTVTKPADSTFEPS